MIGADIETGGLHLKKRPPAVSQTGSTSVYAFNADDLSESMSMEHSRVAIGSIIPASGDALVTNPPRLIVTITEDASSVPSLK